MNRTIAPKKFIFNINIDHEWLHSLYEDDYRYIAEVFSSSLEALAEDLPALATAYENADVSAVRKTVHKIKPVFGFAGLLQHQEIMARFEVQCARANSISGVTMQYIEMIQQAQEGKQIVQEEYNRLTAFLS